MDNFGDKENPICFKGYSCFKNEWSEIGDLKPINVIIGCNNSGKSHFLDLIAELCKYKHLADTGIEYIVYKKINNFLTTSNKISDYSKKFFNSEVKNEIRQYDIYYEVNTNKKYRGLMSKKNCKLLKKIEYLFRIKNISLSSDSKEELKNSIYEIISCSLDECTNYFYNKTFRRILADRDVKRETEDSSPDISPDGTGATSIIRQYLNSADSEFDQDVIKKEFLDSLNEIFFGHGVFKDIFIKKHKDTAWEIYFEEEKKGRIPLSKSGSGLKTIIIVLLNLLVSTKNKNKNEFIFAFEELENNLHPSLLRNIFNYIKEYMNKNNAIFFLTTHSNVAIDFFGKDNNAQIIRVIHDGESSKSEKISGYFEYLELISDLGSRPSDILQANGIVWVEGPSDRIYINRWISLFDNKLKEGYHYQCIFYGGALLANTEAKSNDNTNDKLVNLLSINPNIVLVCDGDRSEENQELKPRVTKIKKDIDNMKNGYIWITEAKEIENYIPGCVIQKTELCTPTLDENRDSIKSPEKYESFFSQDNKDSSSYIKKQTGKTRVDKKELARSSIDHMTMENMKGRFDWNFHMEKIVDRIKGWNK